MTCPGISLILFCSLVALKTSTAQPYPDYIELQGTYVYSLNVEDTIVILPPHTLITHPKGVGHPSQVRGYYYSALLGRRAYLAQLVRSTIGHPVVPQVRISTFNPKVDFWSVLIDAHSGLHDSIPEIRYVVAYGGNKNTITLNTDWPWSYRPNLGLDPRHGKYIRINRDIDTNALYRLNLERIR